MWSIVQQVHEVAREVLAVGVTGVEFDAVARDLIAGADYDQSFGHGLGHGVGLAVHESPRASRPSEDTLESGMTLTFEPGIYLPGEFGVRIEDLVIISEDEVEVLTGTPKEPVVV